MRRYCACVCSLVLAVTAQVFNLSGPGSRREMALEKQALRRAAISTMFSMPLTFEPNVGQAGPRAQFLARGKGIKAWLTRDGIGVQVSARTRRPTTEMITMQFVRIGNPRGEISWRGDQRLRVESNYFLGSDARLWRTRVPHFAKAVATNVVPGVDAKVYGNDEGLEYDLSLAPGIDASELRLKISGVEKARPDAHGNLLLRVGDSELRLGNPRIYQERQNGQKAAIDGEYMLGSDGSIGFRVGAHDPTAALVIDPSLSVTYSTFLGGAGEDSANSIAADSSGKIYVGGTTTSAASFPEPSGKEFGPGGGSTDLFVAKIDPSTNASNSLVYLSFIGGSAGQTGGRIAVDANGDVAIVGTTTSPDFPVTDASKRTSGPNDVSVTEIDPTGGKLLFSTIFGGSGAEATQNPGGIAIDASGNVFIATDTTSADLPVTPGAFRSTYASTTSDGFLAVFTPAATPKLKYCTYLGLNAQVGVGGVAVDSTGNAYLAGFTSDPGNSFPAMNAFQNTFGGGAFDAFLMKIRPSGLGSVDLSYATFLGGEQSDKALAVHVGATLPGTAYVTGTTQSQHFPTNGTIAAFQTSLKGTTNAFFAAVAQNASGVTSLAYSSYLGGSENDAGLSVAFAATNAIYVTGETNSGDFPAQDNFEPFNGDQDAFLAKLDPTSAGPASLVYSTLLGGTAPAGVTSVTQGNGVAADALGHVYLAGETTAADFPRAGSAGNGFQLTCSSCQASPPLGDAFALKINEGAAPASSVSFNAAKLNFGNANVGTVDSVPQTGAVINTGNAPLTISDLSIAGPNSGDFSFADIGNCIGAALAPKQFCSFEIGFAPSTVGPEEAFVTVTDNALGSPQLLAAVGVGNGPLFVASPAALSFGSAPAGTNTEVLPLEVINPGNATLHIQTVQLAGPDAGAFFLVSIGCPGNTSGSGFEVNAGSQCEIDVGFAPSAARLFSAEIDFIDDSGNVPDTKQVVTLAGTGTAPAPIASILPVALGFGSEAVGTTSGVQTVTVTNNGSAPLNFTSIAITGTNAADFGIVPAGSTPCQSGTAVAVGKSCTVEVDFAPQSGGAKSANLAFTDNAGGSPQIVALSGTATAPEIQFAPPNLTFAAPQSVGTSSVAQSITVTNTGNAALAINHPFLVTGANSGDFAMRDTCPPSLGSTPPSNTCAIQVTFTPTASGTRAATLSVSDNAPGSPQSISLSGTGVQAAVSILPAPVSFGSQNVGTVSAAVPVTVTNTGATGSVLQIGSVAIGGADPTDFRETNNCTGNGVNIPAAGTCTIQVTFSPTCAPLPAARSATLTVNDNAADSPQSLAISGTAAGEFCMDPPPAGATTATVTAGQTANYVLDIISMGGFTGSVSLTCSGAPSGAQCGVNPTSVAVNATMPTQFQVSVSTRPRPAASIPASQRRYDSAPGLPLMLIPISAVALLWMLALNRRGVRSTRFVQATLLALLFAIALAACGGGGGGQNPGTPAGTYSLNVTGTSGGANQSIGLTLIVQ